MTSAADDAVFGEQHEPEGVEMASDRAGVLGGPALPFPLERSITLQQLHLPPRRQLHGLRS